MEYQIKDPNHKRPDGNPRCFSQYQENHYVCENKCYKVLTCKLESAEEDSRREGKQFRDASGKPACFGKLYSGLSEECNMFCTEAIECSEITEINENKRTLTNTSRPVVRSESLKVYGQTSPYNYGYNKQQQQYSQNPTIIQMPAGVFNYTIDDKTNAYMKSKYGVPLKIDPTVPGQFEGEPWYERFMKEVFKYAGYYALQLLSAIILQSRWAPSIDEGSNG